MTKLHWFWGCIATVLLWVFPTQPRRSRSDQGPAQHPLPNVGRKPWTLHQGAPAVTRSNWAAQRSSEIQRWSESLQQCWVYYGHLWTFMNGNPPKMAILDDLRCVVILGCITLTGWRFNEKTLKSTIEATTLHPGPEPHHVLCPRSTAAPSGACEALVGRAVMGSTRPGNHFGRGSVCGWHHAQQSYRGTDVYRCQMERRHELYMSYWSENRMGYITVHPGILIFPDFRYSSCRILGGIIFPMPPVFCWQLFPPGTGPWCGSEAIGSCWNRDAAASDPHSDDLPVIKQFHDLLENPSYSSGDGERVPWFSQLYIKIYIYTRNIYKPPYLGDFPASHVWWHQRVHRW